MKTDPMPRGQPTILSDADRVPFKKSSGSSPGLHGSLAAVGGTTAARVIFRTVPKWQKQRARLIHHACLSVQFHVEQRGRGIVKSARRVARRYNGRIINGSHKLALSCGTLVRLYRLWRLGGQIPAVFFLNFTSGRRYIDAALLIRFVNFAADRAWPSFKAAWQAFCNRGGSFGPGRMNGRKLTLGYDALRWNLPRHCFSQLQREWKNITRSEDRIGELRFQFIAEIQSRVPAKLPRHRKGPDFQI